MATTVLDLATDDVAVASIAARVFAVVGRPAGAVDPPHKTLCCD